MKAAEISETLRALGDSVIAEHSGRFFKTGPGEYGEGDRFLGIRMPVIRKQVVRFQHTPLEEVLLLLHSPMHEERMCALLLMVRQFEKGETPARRAIYEAYLSHTKLINNWDLVDCSALQIVGGWLFDRDRSKLEELLVSDLLWERRIAIIATFYFIRRNDLDDTFRFSEQLLSDQEDLMHKATGWMLREAGKRDEERLKSFIRVHYDSMPRTMLRYAIEKLPEEERKRYLRGEFRDRK